MDSTSMIASSCESAATATASEGNCYRCDYALRGIANDQPCPECGLLAERSRRPTDELHNTRPAWLRKLSLGTKLLCLALIVGGAWPVVAGPLQMAIDQYSWRKKMLPWWVEPFGYQLVPFAGIDLTAILIVAGIWLLTRREGYAPSDEQDRVRRVALRVLAIVFAVSMILMHLAVWWMIRMQRGGRSYYESQTLWLTIWTLFFVAIVPMPPMLFAQLRSLARRARSAHLAEHCTIVGIGACGAIVFLLMVGLTFSYTRELGLPSNWSTTSQISLVLATAGSVTAVLFLLWSVYLFVRFTISFHKAAHAMQMKWDRDDRSLG